MSESRIVSIGFASGRKAGRVPWRPWALSVTAHIAVAAWATLIQVRVPPFSGPIPESDDSATNVYTVELAPERPVRSTTFTVPTSVVVPSEIPSPTDDALPPAPETPFEWPEAPSISLEVSVAPWEDSRPASPLSLRIPLPSRPGSGREGVFGETEEGSASGSMAASAPPVFPAEVLDHPSPEYPAEARRMGLEGCVVLRVLVSETGRPEEIGVRSSSGHAILDEAALEAVRRWTFTPARSGSAPLPSRVDIPFRFELSN